jgi:hypothetical protein
VLTAHRTGKFELAHGGGNISHNQLFGNPLFILAHAKAQRRKGAEQKFLHWRLGVFA